MPLRIQCRNITLHDGFLASLAAWGKLLIVTLPAKRFVVFLMETLWTKVLATECAEEMLGMPCLF